jgi:5-methyltetrahydropteroyltriglutamate--homocysteine methyltransferase
MPSTQRILTTHVGSLPRPKDVLDVLKAKVTGQSYDRADFDAKVRGAVAESVKKQVETGIDIVSDGEQSKPGFFSYVSERLEGFSPKPERKLNLFAAEVKAFPEYYAQYFKEAMLGGMIAPFVPLVCTGPVRYRDTAPLQRDIDNLKAAVSAAKAKSAFMPAIAPSGVGLNEYYKTQEEYFHAVGAAMCTEYKAIIDAGLTLQIDDPFLCDILVDPSLDAKGKKSTAWMYVEAINASIKGLSAEKIRFHTCYGINEGPRLNEAPMSEVARYMLKINAGAYSFENANVRHEHEYHLWEDIKLPAGKKIIPGMLLHASNIVEHPELIAERLMRFAKLVGRDNVIAGADCGFSSQASYKTEVHPTVVWAKFEALREGARLASKRLWTKKAKGKGKK